MFLGFFFVDYIAQSGPLAPPLRVPGGYWRLVYAPMGGCVHGDWREILQVIVRETPYHYADFKLFYGEIMQNIAGTFTI